MNETAQRQAGWRLAVHWRILGGAVLLLAAIAVMVLLVMNDAGDLSPDADISIGDLLHGYGYLAGFALLYIEESGIPLFIPGDAFLIYVGYQLPQDLPIYILAWLGFVLAVTLGASNLYLLARRYGRGLLERRIARFLHLTPDRLDRAESWFHRYGVWTMIFGRHIPGLRVPLTVAAGVLKLPYRVFALSVAVSSSLWAGAFLALGAVFGPSVEESIRSSPVYYGLGLGGLILLVVVVLAVRRRLVQHH